MVIDPQTRLIPVRLRFNVLPSHRSALDLQQRPQAVDDNLLVFLEDTPPFERCNSRRAIRLNENRVSRTCNQVHEGKVNAV
jgi:hypothetical protein